MFPVDRLFGAESGLVDLAVRRGGGDAAEADTRATESVGCAERGADIVEGADLVEYQHDRYFTGFPVVFKAQAAEFFVGGLTQFGYL